MATRVKDKPSKLLDKVLNLIEADIKKIKKQAGEKQLEPDTAQTLCRYVTAISSIKDEKENEAAKQKRQLERMSTEELVKLYQQQAKAEKEPGVKSESDSETKRD